MDFFTVPLFYKKYVFFSDNRGYLKLRKALLLLYFPIAGQSIYWNNFNHMFFSIKFHHFSISHYQSSPTPSYCPLLSLPNLSPQLPPQTPKPLFSPTFIAFPDKHQNKTFVRICICRRNSRSSTLTFHHNYFNLRLTNPSKYDTMHLKEKRKEK